MPSMSLLRNCVGCGREVARPECHRNRYGEYVCRDCQAKGFRYSTSRRLGFQLKRFLKIGLRVLAWICLAALVLGCFYYVIDRFASAPVAAPPPE
jgi:hypothetical protein